MLPNFDLNKLSQIFNPNLQNIQQPSPMSPDMGVGMMNMNNQGNQDDQLNQALMSLLTPKDEQYDKFTQMLGMMPQRENYQPGKMRKIGAFLGGLGAGGPIGVSGGQPIGYKSDVPGGLKIQSSILDEPYNQAMSDWGSKAGSTLEAAKLENTRNTQSRLAGSNLKMAQLRERTISDQEDKTRNQNDLANKNLELKAGDQKIRQQRADAYEFRIKNPNHIIKEAGEYLVSIDPQSGESELIRDSSGEPIETGKLDDKTKLQLQLDNSLKEIGARNSASKELEGVKQTNRKDLETTKETNRQKDITARSSSPKTTTTKTETAANRHTRLFDKAVEGINKNPAWNEYIHLDIPHKTFKIDTPESKSGLFGLGAKKGGDPTIAKSITDYIYEGDSAQQDNQPLKRADGKVHVKRKSDGLQGWVTDPDMEKYEVIP